MGRLPVACGERSRDAGKICMAREGRRAVCRLITFPLGLSTPGLSILQIYRFSPGVECSKLSPLGFAEMCRFSGLFSDLSTCCWSTLIDLEAVSPLSAVVRRHVGHEAVCRLFLCRRSAYFISFVNFRLLGPVLSRVDLPFCDSIRYIFILRIYTC